VLLLKRKKGDDSEERLESEEDGEDDEDGKNEGSDGDEDEKTTSGDKVSRSIRNVLGTGNIVPAFLTPVWEVLVAFGGGKEKPNGRCGVKRRWQKVRRSRW